MDVGATYDVHLGLVGKRAGDFLLALIELFSLGDTAEVLRANLGSKSAISLQHRPVDPNFQVEGVDPTNHFSSQKIRLNDLPHGVKSKHIFFRFVTMNTFDRRTVRRTEGILIARPRLHSMHRGKNLRALEHYGLFLIRWSFSSVRKQPKLLPSDTFSGVKIYGKCVWARPRAGF